MDLKEELPLIETNAKEMKIKLEETAMVNTKLQHEVEFVVDSKYDVESCSGQSQNPEIKIEVKEENLWEDGSEEKYHTEVRFESVPVLQIIKEEDVPERADVDIDLPSSTLSTEAGYHNDNSYVCTCPLERVYPTQGNDTSDSNDNESSLRQNFCIVHCNPPSDHHNKNVDSTSELVAHESKQLHICDYCEKGFKKKYYLIRHIVIHLGTKPYKCDSCKKCFNSNSNLKAHMVCHLGIKPYKCDICNKSYNNKSNLTRHVSSHSGARPYKCSHCDKNFTRKSTLRRHALCHSDIKPYKCDNCEKSFIRKSCLIRHALRHSALKT